MTLLNNVAKSPIRTKFFEFLYGDNNGYLCIATTHPDAPQASFNQRFFRWPEEYADCETYILTREDTHNMYFCINLLSERKRLKEFCVDTDLIWADLDQVSPKILDEAGFPVPPPVVLRTSGENYQAIWRLTSNIPALEAQAYSKRVAYATNADKSGWDLTQLLRVPLSINHKYSTKPQIMVERCLELRAEPFLFESLPEAEDDYGVAAPEVPDDSLLFPIESILYKYAIPLRSSQFQHCYTYEPTPEDDWSKHMWKLIHICLEVGMDQEETFSIVRTSPCNKYARDGRPQSHLWRDINKAWSTQQRLNVISGGFRPLAMPRLVDEPASETFIDLYRDWAVESTDAVPQFHDLAAFVLLSSVVSNSVKLYASHGPIVPNLWGLVLGDSTLARKTTAMRLTTDLINAIDPGLILATDGSAEGLLTGLSLRPGRVSIFLKDEVSGFFDSINRKDYLAGMPETMTALYDVPAVMQRMLRKETIRIERPAFIFFGGGVKEKVFESVTEEYVLSGFLPRFCVVMGNTDMAKIRPTGPANDLGMHKRAVILDKIANMYEHYASDVSTSIAGQTVLMPPAIAAEMTTGAWERYAEIEMLMLKVASEDNNKALALPTLDRLSRSLHKMAIILAASNQEPTEENKITVSLDDINNAAWYIQDWGRYSIELINGSTRKASEKLLEKVFQAIQRNPGILRSNILQWYHLTKREADDVLSTLEDRQLVRKEQKGRGWSFYPT